MRAASPLKGKISVICSSKSRRRSQFILTKAPFLVDSASTSSAILSWFKYQASPGHFRGRNAQGFSVLSSRGAGFPACEPAFQRVQPAGRPACSQEWPPHYRQELPRQHTRAAGLLDYQTDRLSCSPGQRNSACHGTAASQLGCRHAPEYSPSGGRQPRRLCECAVGRLNSPIPPAARPAHAYFREQRVTGVIRVVVGKGCSQPLWLCRAG